MPPKKKTSLQSSSSNQVSEVITEIDHVEPSYKLFKVEEIVNSKFEHIELTINEKFSRLEEKYNNLETKLDNIRMTIACILILFLIFGYIQNIKLEQLALLHSNNK